MPKGSTTHGDLMRAVILDELSRCAQPPSIRQLANSIHVTDNTIRHHTRRLIGQGLVTRNPGEHRSLRLTTAGAQWLALRRAHVNGGAS